ncbi:hypothetical protein BSKO_01491 [Bryopsis sp. KO-2023]|nr:hypothetical protein BSKO_01491 [Bryopsis sp. KO-2023]
MARRRLAGLLSRYVCAASGRESTLPSCLGHHASTSDTTSVHKFSRSIFGTRTANAPIVEFPLAQTGEGIAECEVLKWFVNEGQEIARFEKVCEVQSDKASMEITSPYAGIVRKIHHDVGDVVKVGANLLAIEAEGMEMESPDGALGQEVESSDSQPPQAEAPKHKVNGTSGVLATPAVRKLARESNIDISQVAGSGPGGRVLKDDVLNFSGTPESIQTDVEHPKEEVVEKGSVRKPIRGYRRAMLKSMTKAAEIPHFHFCDDVPVGSLMDIRRTLQSSPQMSDVKLTFLPLILKAISVALHEYPDMNSSLDENQRDIVQHLHHNLGVAMATPSGLVVPSIKRVETLSIREIAIELNFLQQKALEGKLTVEDVSGGTLSVSNIGTVGGTYAAPLVNVPEVAIVALGKIRGVPMISEENTAKEGGGSFQLHPMMPVSWGADHRIVDGAMLAGFSNVWKSYLEKPERLLLWTK